MKRICTYLFAVLLAVFSACSKEDVYTTEGMVFSAGDAAVTRAAAAVQPDGAGTLISAGNRFGVFGTLVRSGQENYEVFEKQAVTCGEDLVWRYSPLKYWRRTGVYHFKAVFPYAAECLTGTDGERLLVRHVVTTNHCDLMAASASRNPATQGTEAVNLQFKHACAAVRFLIKKASATYSYALTQFELQNLRVVGTLDITDETMALANWHTGGTEPEASVFAWSAATTADCRNIPTRYEDYAADWYFMIPQTMAVGEGVARPAVKFSVVFNNESTPVVTTLPLPDQYKEGGRTVEAVWEPGKVYNYYINLQPSRVTIDVHVTDWDETTLVAVDIIF